MICAKPGCGRELRGNPNDHQCNDCTECYCGKHQRLTSWGERLCYRCWPKGSRAARR